jgi:hypothetical protein
LKCICCGLNVPLKFMCWKFNPQCIPAGRWSLMRGPHKVLALVEWMDVGVQEGWLLQEWACYTSKFSPILYASLMFSYPLPWEDVAQRHLPGICTRLLGLQPPEL